MSKVKHLKVLGRRADPQALHDVQGLSQLITDLVQSVGMQILGSPQVHDVALDITKLGKEPFEDEGGVSMQTAGFSLDSSKDQTFIAYGTLSTSHLAIHTWPLRGEYHLDLYSCRQYESRDVLQLLKDRLGGEHQSADLSQALIWRD